MTNQTKQAASTESQYNRLLSCRREGLPLADDEIEWLVDQDTERHNIALPMDYELDEDSVNDLDLNL